MFASVRSPLNLIPFRLGDYDWTGVRDHQDRWLVGFGDELTTHTSTVVSNAKTIYGRSLGRVYSAQLELDTAAVTTALIVQVYVNGRPLWENALRPTIAVGATTSTIVRVPSTRHFTRGEPIKSVIEQVDGAQTGTLNVVLKTEPFILDAKAEVVQAPARARFTRKANKQKEPLRTTRRGGKLKASAQHRAEPRVAYAQSEALQRVLAQRRDLQRWSRRGGREGGPGS